MSGSDSDDDNAVRYGTQLEPFEEDHTSAIAKPDRKRPKMSGAATRRYKKLLAANVSHEKARDLCQLWWTEICKQIPGLDANPSENSPSNHPKQAKNSTTGPRQIRVRQETQRSNYMSKSKPEPRSYWHQPYKVRPVSSQENNNGTYREESGSLKSQNRNKTEPEKFPTSQAFYSNQPYANQYSSLKGGTYLNYCDGAESSQVTGLVQMERQPFECGPYQGPSWSQTYASMQWQQGANMNYWNIPDISLENCPNNTNLMNAPSWKNESCKQGLSPDPDGRSDWQQNYHANLHYGEPDRPTRVGLRNKTHPMGLIPRDYSFDDQREQMKTRHKDETNFNFWKPDRPSRIGLRNQTHPPERILSGNVNRNEYNWKQTHWANPDSSRVGNKSNATRYGLSQNKYDFNQPLETLIVENSKLNSKPSNPLKLIIKNVKPMSEDQMDLVQYSINKVIVNIGVSGGGPKILGSIHKNGLIIITCENKASKKWLEREVPKLKPWPEANLCVRFKQDLSQYKPYVLTALIPKTHKVNVITTLKLFWKQNRGLKTENWKVLNYEKIEPGYLLSLALDEPSFRELKLKNFKAMLGTSRITFRLKYDATGKKPVNSQKAKPTGKGRNALRKGPSQINTVKKNKVKVKEIPSSSVRSMKQGESKSTVGTKVPSEMPVCVKAPSPESNQVKTEDENERDNTNTSLETVKLPSEECGDEATRERSPSQSSTLADWLPW